MRRLAIILALFAGCGSATVDPCADESGTCLAVHLWSRVDSQLDQLTLNIAADATTGEKQTQPLNGRPVSLPVAVGVVFGTPITDTLEVRLDVAAHLLGQLVGTGAGSATLHANEHQSMRIELVRDGGGDDLAATDFSLTDFAGIPPDDGDLPDGDADQGLDAAPACVNLECQRPSCDGGVITSIHGTVSMPSGDDPVYNALVYIRNAPLAPLPQGAYCGSCGASGSPVVITTTAVDGSFTLTDVPAGDNLPLVIQAGRWRREIPISVPACADTAIDPTLTRLPKNKVEGEIPLHAVMTGSADGMECLLRKMGVDDAEFTGPAGSGRIHIYVNNGATVPSPGSPATLINSLPNYDVVVLSCEGAPVVRTTTQIGLVQQFADNGGRLFVGHHEHTYISTNAEFSAVADWDPGQSNPSPVPFPAILDVSFPAGAAMSAWLRAAGGLGPDPSPIPISEPRHTVNTVNAAAQRWVYADSPVSTQLFTVDTPTSSSNRCGRVLFSDFHMAASSAVAFPTECDTLPLSAAQQVLEYQLIDLSRCQ